MKIKTIIFNFITFSLLLTPIVYAAEDNEGQTALMRFLAQASEEVRAEAVKLLLEGGADLRFGETVLMRAIEQGDEDKVKLALTYSNLDLQDIAGETPLMRAAENGRSKIVDLILEKEPKLDMTDNNNETALMKATRGGHLEIVQSLLKEFANIRGRNNNNETVLSLAKDSGHPVIIELIEARMIPLNLNLLRAAAQGDLDGVRQALESGINVNFQNRFGHTALMRAAENGRSEIVDLILEKEPDLNMTDQNNETALMKATRGGHLEVVQSLLKEFANINETVLRLAEESGHPVIIELIRARMPRHR